MGKSPKEMLHQVERECARARGYLDQAGSVLAIAVFDLVKTMQAGEDNGELNPVYVRLNRAVDAVSGLRDELLGVARVVEIARVGINHIEEGGA